MCTIPAYLSYNKSVIVKLKKGTKLSMKPRWTASPSGEAWFLLEESSIQHSQHENSSVAIMLRDKEKELETEDCHYVTRSIKGLCVYKNVYKDSHVHFTSALKW